jgi:hypothetical protein
MHHLPLAISDRVLQRKVISQQATGMITFLQQRPFRASPGESSSRMHHLPLHISLFVIPGSLWTTPPKTFNYSHIE